MPIDRAARVLGVSATIMIFIGGVALIGDETRGRWAVLVGLALMIAYCVVELVALRRAKRRLDEFIAQTLGGPRSHRAKWSLVRACQRAAALLRSGHE